MINKPSKKSPKVATKTIAKRVATKTAKPRGTAPKSAGLGDEKTPSELISEKIAALGDWRGEILGHLRRLIMEAYPGIIEEVKWRKPSNPAGVPVWSCNGMICTGETYKTAVKLTFDKGAALPDPAGLFNSSLEGNVRRAIDLHEGDTIDESAFKNLVRAAVSLNSSGIKK